MIKNFILGCGLCAIFSVLMYSVFDDIPVGSLFGSIQFYWFHVAFFYLLFGMLWVLSVVWPYVRKQKKRLQALQQQLNQKGGFNTQLSAEDKDFLGID